MKEIESWWRSHYGSNIPVGHILREQIPNRWFRIHSLPESQRYPGTPDEYSILFTRHNAIATEILGSNTDCMIFVGRYHDGGELDIESQRLPQIQGINFSLLKLVLVPELIWIWCAPIVWAAGRFDDIIKSIADEQDAHILFVSLETGDAYAPYDGGADLFLSSTSRRDELKQRYVGWLSSHPLGL